MIYLDIIGRCGNQLFQYAFARKIGLLNNVEDISINFFHVDRWKKKTNDDTFCNQLQYFNVPEFISFIDARNSVFGFGSRKQKRLLKLYPIMRKLGYKFNKIKLIQRYKNKMQVNGIFKEDEFQLVPVVCKSTNIFLKGYFENPIFFEDIKELLQKEFTPVSPRKEKNKFLYDIIDNTESVCVSFRIWHDIEDNRAELEKRDVCSKVYYLKAIQKMHELHPDAHFVVFSNDINWVKNNIVFNYPVSFEDGSDDIWEKLRMMYSCKHFVMSTSTFCWWAQFLCRNPNKTVISPNKWYSDGENNHLLMDSWIKINIE